MCRQCRKSAPDRIRAAAKQAHEKEEKKHAKDSSSSTSQKTIAKLEEQLKAAKNEKSKEPDVVSGSVDDGSGAADVDELRTLVDLSNKYFPESVHNATLREKLDTERKKKQDAKASPGSDLQHVKTIGEEAKIKTSTKSKNHRSAQATRMRGSQRGGVGSGHR